jgi:hypothetical protein
MKSVFIPYNQTLDDRFTAPVARFIKKNLNKFAVYFFCHIFGVFINGKYFRNNIYKENLNPLCITHNI